MPFQSQLRQHSAEIAIIVRILDISIIFASLKTILDLMGMDLIDNAQYQYPSMIALLAYLISSEMFGVYQSARLETTRKLLEPVLRAWISVVAILLFLAFASKTSETYSRIAISFWFAIVPLLFVGERLLIMWLLHRYRRQGKNIRSYLILGKDHLGKHLQREITKLPWTGLKCVGLHTHLETVMEEIVRQQIDYVFLAYSYDQQDSIKSAMEVFSDTTTSVYLASDQFLAGLANQHWTNLGEIPMIILSDHPFYGLTGKFKELEDFILASFILLLCSPIMLLIAIAIKLTSKGPILFKQRRYGLNGQTIMVYKFRTMSTMDDGNVIKQATINDIRINPLGGFLRRSSLDELPQFINVLQGTMSVVGPRPHAIAHNEYYRKLVSGYMMRHKVKPGITGWAQVNGLRGETQTIAQMNERVKYDLFYINNWSFAFDLKIILMTIYICLLRKNAY